MKKLQIPKALGAAADLLYDIRQQRLEAQRVVDALQAQETEVKEHIINTLPKSQAEGVTGKKCRVTIVTKPVPQVQDWDAFYAYVKKHGAFDLLQRRLTETAVRERWEANQKVPGVVEFKAVTLSVNKV